MLRRRCATSINMAWDGSDKYTRAFATASQVKRLNSFSLVSLYFEGKSKFLEAVRGCRCACLFSMILRSRPKGQAEGAAPLPEGLPAQCRRCLHRCTPVHAQTGPRAGRSAADAASAACARHAPPTGPTLPLPPQTGSFSGSFNDWFSSFGGYQQGFADQFSAYSDSSTAPRTIG